MNDNYDEEIKYLNKLAQTIEVKNPKYFQEGLYCDAIDETKKWCLAEILVVKDKNITVHFEGWSDKYNNTFNINHTSKIAPLRKYSKNYSGQSKIAYRTYEFKIEDYNDIMQWLDLCIETQFKCFKNAFDTTQLLRGKLYTFIDIFMTTKYTNDIQKEIIPLIMNLLYKYIDFVIAFMKFYIENAYIYDILVKYPDLYLADVKCSIVASYPEIISTLLKIFGKDNRVNDFFRNNAFIIKSTNAKSQSKFCIDNLYKSNIEKDGVSSICIANFIDYFYMKNGVDLILKAIKETRKSINIDEIDYKQSEIEFKVPFFIIFNLIDILNDIDCNLSGNLNLKDEYLKIYKILEIRITFLTEMELKETKRQAVNLTANSICKLLREYINDKSLILREQLILTYLWKCCSSKFFNLKLQAFTGLTNILALLKFISLDSKNEEEPFFKNIKKEIFLKFLVEKKIVSIIFENIHEEIIKRTIPIITFLASNNVLDDVYYDIIWKSYLTKHESVANQMKSLIIELSFHSNEKEKLKFFNNMVKNEVKNYKQLELIKNYTLGCLNNQKININTDENKLYGIPFLWKIICSADNKDLIDKSIEYLVEILLLETVDMSVKERFLKLSMLNIKNNESSTQCFLLIKGLINGISNYKSTGKLLKSLDIEFNFMTLIFNSISKFKSQLIYLKNSNEINNTVNFYSVNENYKIRLECLEYLISTGYSLNEKLSFSFDNFLSLWNFMLETEDIQNEKNVFYEFLIQNIKTKYQLKSSLIRLIGEKLFKNVLCDPKKFSSSEPYFNIQAFQLFKEMFIVVNQENQNIIFDVLNVPRINSSNLIGLEQLILIISNANDADIQINASLFLSKMIIRLSSYSQEFCKNFWNKIVKMISDEFSKNNSAQSKRGMVILMKHLYLETENNWEIVDQNMVKFAEEGYDIKFNIPHLGKSRVSKISIRDKFMNIRLRMSYFYDIPFDKIVIVIKKTKFSIFDDFKDIKEFISSNETITILEEESPISQLKINPRSLLISNDLIYNQLYSLLDKENELYDEYIWFLISNFNYNSQFFKELNISKNLYNLLKSNSNHKLKYNLMILYEIINNDVVEKNGKFVFSFIENNCIDVLISIFNDVKSGSKHFPNSLNYVCLIINDCISFIKKNNRKNFVSKDLINFCFTSIVNIFKNILQFEESSKLICNQISYEEEKDIKSLYEFERNFLQTNIQILSEPKYILKELRNEWNDQNFSFKSLKFLIKSIIDLSNDVLKKDIILRLEENNEYILTCLVNVKSSFLKTSIGEFINEIMTENISKGLVIGNLNFLIENVINPKKINSNDFNSSICKNLIITNEIFEKILNSLNFMDSELNDELTEYLNKLLINCVNDILESIKKFNYNITNYRSNSYVEGLLKILHLILKKCYKIIEKNVDMEVIVKFLFNDCIFNKCQSKIFIKKWIL